MQPRNNPAASSMIRVPGVLGQSERYALETLQRAGLNVNTKYIRQPVKKYAGRSGMVVKQTPSAGGISMLGSSVTIMIYKVEDKPIDKSAGGYDDAGGYDNAGSGNAGGDDGSAGGGYNGGAAGGGYDGSAGGGYNGGAAGG
ncbi:MAG: PASTA domain-containing protein, partial [Gammaproteobacteria bacterium]|nr:PASTA domain-containing protein [Gammaproteobacteria bacterium]